jgi:hypothetical protein
MAPAPQVTESKGGAPTQGDIARALETVKADANLAAERTINTLRWKTSASSKPSGTPVWLTWLAGLFRWMDRSARVLVWGVLIGLALALAVYVARLLRARRGGERGEESLIAPTHVRELDIRPESLPPDIGAAAGALWDRHEHRASLALLYRGTLSRLAHVHAVPIRDSSTEGDCVALASGRVPQRTCEYVSRVVRVWQRFGYGHEEVPDVLVYGLCDDFASALDRLSVPSANEARGAA